MKSITVSFKKIDKMFDTVMLVIKIKTYEYYIILLFRFPCYVSCNNFFSAFIFLAGSFLATQL